MTNETTAETMSELSLIARLAADRFAMPIALVNVVENDSIVTKGCFGITDETAPDNQDFCKAVLGDKRSLAVEDLQKSDKFKDSPLVTGPFQARSYAGAPLLNEVGETYGTLCLVDTKTRKFTAHDQEILELMASHASQHIELTKLRRRDKTFNIVNDSSADAFMMFNQTGRITHWNKAAETLIGWTRDEALGLHVSAIVPPHRLEKLARMMGELVAAKGGTKLDALELLCLCKDGTIIDVELNVSIAQLDGETQIVSVIRDIGKRKKAEEEQKDQKKMIDAILHNMPAAIYARDAETGKFIFANKEFERITGFKRRDLFGVSVSRIFSGEVSEEHSDERLCAMETGSTIEFDMQMKRADKELRTVRITKICTRGPDGKPVILGFTQDVTEDREAQERISYLANHDSMTGLLSRSKFQEELKSAFEGDEMAIIALDLDRFKIVNDLYGHGAGDAVLIEVAKRLKSATDYPVARLGGDEFAILVKDPSQASKIARRCVEMLGMPFGIHDRGVSIGASAGVAIMNRRKGIDAGNVDQLVQNADLALYRAKNEGRNRTCFFEAHMDDAARERRRIESQLRQAIENNDIHVEYQPLASAKTGKIISYEALARWTHPDHGNIPPALFIPIAEESGLMSKLGNLILTIAATEAATWEDDLKVAVNLSPAQLEDEHVVEDISQVLKSTGLDPNRLEIEITEGMLIGNVQHGIKVLNDLHELGVCISMDDFGTGYSSLNYFRTFPFDKVKIDQSFVSDMHENPQSLAIIQAVIGLGRGLGMPVVAEGVENETQFNKLREEGCDVIQGYHVGRPGRIGMYRKQNEDDCSDLNEKNVA